MAISLIRIIFLISFLFSTMGQTAARDDGDRESTPYPLMAFKLTPPRKDSADTEIYLLGSIHTFPYGKYPQYLRELIEMNAKKPNFLLVTEHGAEGIDSVGLLTDQDEPWEINTIREKYELEKETLSPNLKKMSESILDVLPMYTSLRFPYAFLFASMCCSENLARYTEGLDEILSGRFPTQKYLESIQECLEGLITFKSLSEFTFSSLEEEGEKNEEDQYFSYQTSFDISTLENDQKRDILKEQSNPSCLAMSETKHIQRNRAWMTPLLSILEEHNQAFIVVGIDHLLSQQGLLSLLQQEGVTIERLWSNGRHEPFIYSADY